MPRALPRHHRPLLRTTARREKWKLAGARAGRIWSVGAATCRRFAGADGPAPKLSFLYRSPERLGRPPSPPSLAFSSSSMTPDKASRQKRMADGDGSVSLVGV
ncbi:hypothetical protein BRADI_1g45025v3 [Brachypodium distachyon]|uniref:Uncharacterized protein n=1 Tax=Brachypodium distachyon TaxID=15368 RepID=A0A0Q3S1A7_BRADI|nr:hypothetical protein BRADI_1g45025v3 [Brachypodium distachyon]